MPPPPLRQPVIPGRWPPTLRASSPTAPVSSLWPPNEQEEERFDAAMQDPGEEPPRDGQDIMDRCYYIAMQLAEFVHEFPGLRVPVRKPRSGGTS